MTTLYWHDWSGYIGVLLVLLAFLLLQAHRLHGNGLTYQLLNAFGALGVLLSLVFGSFNTSAFVMEAAWLLISVYGIVRGARLRRERRDLS
ncbi:CBU_0592 family membrane protein [Rhodanobacter caeni]|uniref:CBU-0592-like domain-containing protein n=1 Tax=Rhodanobacter caeni TaxID=657654 RepID=A0ABN0U7F9_9GAMM